MPIPRNHAGDAEVEADDPTVVDAKPVHLNKRLAYLRRYEGVPRAAFLEDMTLQPAVERALQQAIEVCLAIGRRLLIESGATLPNTHREIVSVLTQAGLVPAELCETLSDMAGLRNILVHEYEEVDLAIVHAALTGKLDDLEGFARAVMAYRSGRPSAGT